MRVESLDHLVLTVRSIPASCEWYARICGMETVTFGEERKALAFGAQKINLHAAGKEFEPKASTPFPGSADLCFLTTTPMEAILAHLASSAVKVIEGPVRRTGAQGPLLSVYVRDPDGNLIEIANRVE